MISLKKLIDSASLRSTAAEDAPETADRETPTPPDSASVLRTYRTALGAISHHGQRALPVLGNMIQEGLTPVIDGLNREPSPEAIRNSGIQVEERLSLWADKAQRNQKESEQTIRDLLKVIFEAAESTGGRDEKFSREISELTERLRKVAGLDSLPAIRRSIHENATALTHCVVRMADEGRESVRKLNSEIAEYQSRLLASERRAVIDALTGLCNRRGFEQQLEARVEARQPFSLLVVDLNDFKNANDRYGHLVGDEILRRFAAELKAQFLPEDTVARWGGDEFVGIVGGAPKEAAVRADRIRHWVLGEYKITVDNQVLKVVVDAALGVTAWNGAESGLALFARADREMYRAKEKAREMVAG
jgi:diguanylate cyclase (GGDEF)-like protein